MKISPSTSPQKPKYPVLIVSAAVASVLLSSCQQPEPPVMGGVRPIEETK